MITWFHNLAFRYKLMLPIAILVLVFAVFAAKSMGEVSGLGGELKEVVDNDIPGISTLLEADRDLYQSQVAERGLIVINKANPLYPDLVKQHASNMQQAHDRLNKFAEIAKRSGLIELNGMSAKIEDYHRLREIWEPLSKKVVSLRENDTEESRTAAETLSFGEAGTAFEAMRDVIDQITSIVNEHTKATAMETEENVQHSMLVLGTILAIVLGVCVIVVVVLPPLVTRPLQNMLAHVNDIAEGEGDLTVRLEAKSKDETGQLAGAFNRFIEKLQNLIAETVANSNALVDAATQVAEAAADSDRVVGEQLAQIELVATAMNEMSATTQDVASNATHAAEGARAADMDARSGATVVNDTVTSINQLAEAVQNASGAITELDSESTNIGAVLEVIKGIAEQTSLLALNAAIEAARAGEQGRGFAVVADEVRNLASRTQQSTQEIHTMIESLQSSARHAVSVMQSGSALADESVNKAAEAGGSLGSITNAVATITDMNTQIASAAEEQSSVSEEINANTNNIHQLAEQAAEGSRRTAGAADELSSLAQQMQARMSRFKV